MQSYKSKSIITNVNDKQAYEVKFISGTTDMKVLLNELITCRMSKKHEH